MPSRNRAHYSGSFPRQAAELRRAAYANPATRCARCGRTLAQHPPTKTGKPPRWTAGHVIDGQVGGALQPEVKSCGSAAGAAMGNRKRKPPPDPPARQTERTWRL